MYETAMYIHIFKYMARTNILRICTTPNRKKNGEIKKCFYKAPKLVSPKTSTCCNFEGTQGTGTRYSTSKESAVDRVGVECVSIQAKIVSGA